MSFLKKFLKKLLSFLKKVFEWIKKGLVVLLIVAALMFALSGAGFALPGLLSMFAVASPYVAAGLALTASFLIDKDTTTSIIGDVVDGVGSVIGEAVGEAGEIIGEGISGLVSGIDPMIWIVGGGLLLAYAALSSPQSPPEPRKT